VLDVHSLTTIPALDLLPPDDPEEKWVGTLIKRLCRNGDPNNTDPNDLEYELVVIHEFQSLNLDWHGSWNGTVNMGSVSTTDAVPESIAVDGFLHEMDDEGFRFIDCDAPIQDPFVSKQDGTGIVRGSDLELGTHSMAMHRQVRCMLSKHLFEFTLMVSYTAT
jgi:hypothetical protein